MISENYHGSGKHLVGLGTATPRIRHNTPVAIPVDNTHSTQLRLTLVALSNNNLDAR